MSCVSVKSLLVIASRALQHGDHICKRWVQKLRHLPSTDTSLAWKQTPGCVRMGENGEHWIHLGLVGLCSQQLMN